VIVLAWLLTSWAAVAAEGRNAASSQGFDAWPGETPPALVDIDTARLAQIDDAVRDAIARQKCPGAVVLVARRGRVVWWRPYGQRMLGDAPEPMSRETVFDLASLTKVIATATSVMVLVDRGQVLLTDRVGRHVPEFATAGKESITVEQLLRHRGGLIADNPLADYRDGPAAALDRIWQLRPLHDPDSRFLYTDVGYIVLGELVQRVGGMPLDQFARANVFEPLGMTETTFRPDGFLSLRAAPTERRDGRWMRGEVHDPRAHLLGGVAGHAGLFATSRDVAAFAHMIMGQGELHGRRVLSPAAVAAMTSSGATPPGQARGLGWDIDTSFSAPRGDLFPRGGFGHTGFTGTSLWIDPASQTVVVILTNRVHPAGKGDVTELRRRVATIVAASIGDGPDPN